MTALLTENLPLLAGAPNSIRKLRELILELAMRGKLVPQDSNDEPASKLLERIAKENAQLVSEGKIKKQKILAEIGEEEKPFDLPKTWSWARLGELVDIVYGKGLPTSELTNDGYEVFGANGVIGYYSSYLYEEPQLLVSCRGAYSGKPNISPNYCFVTSNSLVLKNSWKNLSLKFFFYSLSVAKKEKIVTGSAQPQVTTTNLDPFLVVVPPISEQHRIVAKVDALMALFDRIEAQQADAESAHAQLVQALLDSLTQSSDTDDFATNWQRLAEHFHTLFTTEPSIDALKQNLLQLAVMGKLVSRSNGIHADSTSAISQQPYILPQNWLWCEFGSTWESSFYGPRFGKEDYVASGGIPTIRTTDMSSGGLIEMRNPPQVQVPAKKLDLYKLRTGDLLVTRSGSIGTMALFLQDTLAIPSAYLIRIRFLPTIAPQFGLLYLRSPLGQNLLGLNTTSVGVPNVSATKMALFPLPLPPIDEQHRIVAKVDQLMALCDQLKTRLTQARQLNEQLASTLVEQAVA